MKKFDVVQLVLKNIETQRGANLWLPQREKGLGFAPVNIALCKYWGKRDLELNLPMTSSLSIALPDKGALTEISLTEEKHDQVILNGNELENHSDFVKRLTRFLDLFRPNNQWYLKINIKMNIAVAAGLASSACGFASLTLALNDLFQWQLNKESLSIIARLGSGSATRSFWNGFVEWHAGVQSDGMDSFAQPLNFDWPEFRIGILPVDLGEKTQSSRDAMQQTVDTSLLYTAWPKKVARDLVILRQALKAKNFALLGGVSESNALGMHATMLSSWPPICYILPKTLEAMYQVWNLRKEGYSIFFTQDAGPNLKILFLEHEEKIVKQFFKEIEVIRAFDVIEA